MQTATLRTVAQATHGKILRGSPDIELTGISTNTATLRAGELFFALCGDKHDAHRFLPDAQARRAGATAASSCPAERSASAKGASRGARSSTLTEAPISERSAAASRCA